MGEPKADPQAFMELFLANQRRLYQYVLALVPNEQDAEDVLQETSKTLWEKFGEFRPGSNFFAWGAQVARFKVLRFYRGRKAPSLLAPDVIEQLATDAADDEELLQRHQEALQHCLGRLPEKDEQLIRRRYEPGGRQALARELGRPANSISKSLGRIRATLLECIGRQLAQYERSMEKGGAP